ncbi:MULTISPECIES: LysR family transcriptional regulator [unclassified Aureimonas]|uniref:LysR family transcriptional regulator n=1 Tax=unclassified Aureimonas TaxID=2615206 RepID=UPI0006FBE140|nr:MULTISPECIES: LysR family transcriptional regulator [unclassified Aureimonas]KQT57552.1 LysR family transcriptional regulator [Aureimonas sp. Leaf427]KQT77233.1 LysR family transcriptional regulator [Aureimonas sp. Leaf460]
MRRENVNDLIAFVEVARERSFTKAAAKLGVSQSALSYTVRTLEARLGIQLLTRTTRSMSLTDAGARLFDSIQPRLDEIDREVTAISGLRDKPAGTVRITSVEHAAETLLWPKLAPLLRANPDVNVEIINDYRLVDIAADRFDGGVRFGGHVDKDMIAVRLSSGFRTAIVASPSYLETRRPPKVPQDLVDHDCIGLRLPTHGGLYAWDFRKGVQTLEVRIHGRVVFNSVPMMRQAAVDGMGLAYMPEDYVEDHLRDGRLIRVLEDWCPPMPGYHLYYTSRRQPSPAFALVIEALRFRF